MKRVSIVCLVVLTLVISVISVSASEMNYGGVTLPEVEVSEGYQTVIFTDTSTDSIYYVISNLTVYANYTGMSSKGTILFVGTPYISGDSGSYHVYILKDGAWTYKKGDSNISGAYVESFDWNQNTICVPIWSNIDVIDAQTKEVILTGSLPAEQQCDGSTCPATDQNHDNVCDVCGNVLTLSLRSTLLDYAHAVIENGKSIFDSTEYWIVTEDPPSDGYRIFMSTEPFTYNPNTGNLISNGIVQRTTVSQEDDGSFTGGTSWASKQPTSYTSLDYGRPVDTSHDILDFFPVTLWMEMTQVTETEMENLQGETAGTMKVLVACGVGLIALLVVLKLFGKRSLIFRD